ncbi:ATP-binding cassette domain-containing protein [Streptomyces sp. NPDC002677]|uniref:ATP-binding cassette domain-containing protein n=1 Tax=Streptomyces sp. NPDC002677 TaxID=3154774 RepID=UPI00332368FD
MLGYVFAGLVLGGIYAISAASIVVTYVSAGVLNFAFGSIAFFIARFYYFLNVQQGWPVAPAAVVAICVVGPLLGVAFHYLLFRFLTQASSLTKVASTIGLSVAITAASELVFGNKAILTSPGLAPKPVRVYHFAGATVTLDQIIAYGCIVAVLAVGTYVLRRTGVGLMVRSTVDSEALTSLSGISPARVAVGVWTASTFLAGLAGVLAAPILNVSSVDNYTLLTASAFAAVVAARLRSLPLAVGVGVLMGIVGSLLQWLLPASSKWTADVISSIPFAMVLVFLLVYSWRGSVGRERTGGSLDRATATAPQTAAPGAAGTSRRGGPLAVRAATGLAGLIPRNLFLTVAAVLPLLLTGYRVGLVAEALAMGIVFLSYTLLTGEAGLISLCQISFAGVGALATGQAATVFHLPVLLGVLIGGLLAGVGGLVVGALTVRMGNLYVALVTLTVGLFLSSVVFTADRFVQFGVGVTVDRPGFASDDRTFSYFMLAMFVVAGLIIAAVRRSTTGLALGALRSSETGARATGVSVLRMKTAVFMVAAMLAGFGGGFLAIYNGSALPSSYSTIAGLVWFAVLVTNGTRTNNAALASGLFFVFLPDIFSSYLPVRLGPVPDLLFGVGAVLLARNPEGVISLNGRQLRGAGRALLGRLRPRTRQDDTAQPAVPAARPAPAAAEPSPTPVPRAVADPTRTVLSARGVSVRFGGLKALQNVDIDVPAGTVVGLLGPNGAGKSTLLGVLSGNVHAQEGTVLLAGEEVSGMTPQGRVRHGLARTFQHPELSGDLTVRDHLLLAHRLDEKPSRSWSDPFTGRHLRTEPGELTAVEQILDLLGLADAADLPVAGLPLGMCRLVEIGRALATGPQAVLLDEPFSGLNAGESRVLAEALARIVATRGISMLLVEHDVEIVFGLSSRVYVLDFGQLIAKGTPAEIRADETVRSAYLGEVEAVPEPGPRAEATTSKPVAGTARARTTSSGEPILRIEDLAVDYGNATAVRGVSLSVPGNAVTALLGANGAGKSTLARAVCGLVPVRSGRIVFDGTDITGLPAHRIRRLGLAHLPEGRGVFPALTVAENLRIAVQTAPKAERAQATDRAMELFPILADRRTQIAGTMSGGQQQMLSLARILAHLPRLVIADEISLGLAPLVVDEVFEGLERAIDMGVSLIVIEQFVHRALQIADECHILRRGRLVWSGAAADARGDVFDHYLGNTGQDRQPVAETA